MAITDLTGSTWILNTTVDPQFYDVTFNIYFTSNDTTYKGVRFDVDIGVIFYNHSVGDSFTLAYNGGWWINGNYRTISITGGTDATNADLIAWLEDNATWISGGRTAVTFDLSTLELSTGTHTITVKATATGKSDSIASNAVEYEVAQSEWGGTDLTGTTWEFNATNISMPGEGSDYAFSVNFTAQNIDYNYIDIVESLRATEIYYYSNGWNTVYSNGWYDDNNRVIYIAGGTDATNATLIAWLRANATLISW